MSYWIQVLLDFTHSDTVLLHWPQIPFWNMAPGSVLVYWLHLPRGFTLPNTTGSVFIYWLQVRRRFTLSDTVCYTGPKFCLGILAPGPIKFCFWMRTLALVTCYVSIYPIKIRPHFSFFRIHIFHWTQLPFLYIDSVFILVKLFHTPYCYTGPKFNYVSLDPDPAWFYPFRLYCYTGPRFIFIYRRQISFGFTFSHTVLHCLLVVFLV